MIGKALTPKRMSEKNEKEWEFSKTEDGLTSCVRVERVSNGYLVTKQKYGCVGEGDDSEYIDERERFISKDNPLKDGEPKEEEKKDNGIKSLLNSINGGLDIN